MLVFCRNYFWISVSKILWTDFIIKHFTNSACVCYGAITAVKKQTVFKQINLLNFKWEIIGILDSIDIAFIP